MNTDAGIKSITITPLEKGMADVSARIEMPGMSCNLAVQLQRSNCDLQSLQLELLRKAIDSLSRLKELIRG